jgi:hypothetical protein
LIKDIPVGTVASTYGVESETFYVLIIHEALFFGTSMDHSLINQNQIQHHGIPVCDNSFDAVNALWIDRIDAFISSVA